MIRMRGKHRFLAASLVFIVLASPRILLADHVPDHIPEEERHDAGWEVYFDNDAFSLLPLDRDYTAGFAVTHFGRRVARYPFGLEQGRNKIDQWLGSENRYRSKNVFKLHSFGYGLSAFTPQDTSVSTPIYNDRPYASLLFIANTQQAVVVDENTVYQSTLMLGVLGLGIAEAISNALHSALGQGTQNGWHNQISNGGEPTARYTMARQVTHVKHYVKKGIDFEFKTTRDFSIGYLTDMSVGMNSRFGNIRSPWWSFNPQQLDYINMGIPTSRTGGEHGVSELYGWVGVNFRVRAYNALLQGQFRESAVTLPHSELNPFIVESWAGVTKRFKNGYRLSFVLRTRTAELKVGASENPIWASIILGHSF